MSSHTTLDAAATERKARLAKLKSLKRKQPSSSADTPSEGTSEPPSEATPSITQTYLSGRNFDATSHGPKLGFESAPSAGQETLEIRAKEIADATKAAADEEEKADKPLDLFKLQPKKPNWDLKRDLAKKLEVLNVQTDNAIARVVRERIEGQRRKAREEMKEKGKGEVDGNGEEGEAVGLKGEELVEGIHLREREEAEEEARKKNEDEDEDV